MNNNLTSCNGNKLLPVDPKRKLLEPHVGEKVEITGVIIKWDKWEIRRTSQYYPTVCLLNVEKNFVEITDHIWVHHAEIINESGASIGERILLKAMVTEYVRKKPKRHERTFGLAYPEQVETSRSQATCAKKHTRGSADPQRC